MKKLFIPLAFLLMVCPNSYAEGTQDEAISSLDTAQAFVKQGNFNKAVEEINYALAKINELTAEGLLNFIPDPPAGYTLVSKNSQGVDANAAMAIAGNAGANAQYSNEEGSTLNLSIAIGGMSGKMASLAALGSMFAGLSQDSGAGGQTKKIRVQGYTGTQMFDGNANSGTLTFQVSEKTSVSIDGTNIESPDILIMMAKYIDLAGLEKNY